MANNDCITTGHRGARGVEPLASFIFGGEHDLSIHPTADGQFRLWWNQIGERGNGRMILQLETSPDPDDVWLGVVNGKPQGENGGGRYGRLEGETGFDGVFKFGKSSSLRFQFSGVKMLVIGKRNGLWICRASATGPRGEFPVGQRVPFARYTIEEFFAPRQCR